MAFGGLTNWFKKRVEDVRDVFDANTQADQQRRISAGQPRYYQDQQAQRAPQAPVRIAPQQAPDTRNLFSKVFDTANTLDNGLSFGNNKVNTQLSLPQQLKSNTIKFGESQLQPYKYVGNATARAIDYSTGGAEDKALKQLNQSQGDITNTLSFLQNKAQFKPRGLDQAFQRQGSANVQSLDQRAQRIAQETNPRRFAANAASIGLDIGTAGTGAQALKGVEGVKAITPLVKEGALLGGASGVLSTAGEENPTMKSLLMNTGAGVAIGGALPVGVYGAGKLASKALPLDEVGAIGKGEPRNGNQIPKVSSQTNLDAPQQLDLPLAEITKQSGATRIAENATTSPRLPNGQTPTGNPLQKVGLSPQEPASIVQPSNLRQRGFIETVAGDPNTAPQIKDSVSSLYNVRNTKELQTKAANLVKDNPDMALRVARAGDGDISIATGSELVKHLQSVGNYEQAIDVTNELAAQLTKAGQTAQAASIYGRLTPEGVLRFAQREINKYNDALGKKLQLTPQQAKNLTEQATKLQTMADGRAKDVATKQMVNDIYRLLPSTWTQKAATLQTMAQLLNPKTLIRNVAGNSMFGIADNVSQTIATPIDKLVSAVTGNPRTTTLPNIKIQGQGLVKGFKQGVEEAGLGINLGPNTQFELNDIPAFRSGLLGGLEKTMNVSLRAPDRAAYTAAFDDTINGLMKVNNVTKPTADMLEQAHYNGLYRTFQDDSKAAQVFVGLKRVLNKVGFERNGDRFGLGDFILKYPKTPANLIARGVDYSPVGVLRGIINIAKGKQQVGVNTLARGAVGTAIVGAGNVLGSLGIITDKPEKDADLRNLQKKSGLGGYQINVSALKRFILSGFDPKQAEIKEGDVLTSYDWAQPLAIPLSMGAAMGRGEGVKEGAQRGVGAVAEGVQTLAEQPLVQGVQKFFGGSTGTAADKLVDTAKDMPASFIPTASSQINQLFDNTSRNTYDPSPAKEALNKVKAKIPGAAQTLNPLVDTLGDNKERYQNGGNNPFNVFLNPAFVSKYKPSDEAKLALDIYNRTGETKQAPRVTKTTQTVNGEKVTLTPQQNEDFQRYVGQSTKRAFNEFGKDQAFLKLSDEEKANKMSSTLTDIVKAGKIAILNDKPDKVSSKVRSALNGGVFKIASEKTRLTTPESFQSELNDFNQAVKNGELSPAQRIKKENILAKKSVYKDYSTEAQDYYTLYKSEIKSLVDQGKIPDKTLKEMQDMDSKLLQKGVIKYSKFGYTSSSKGGRRSTGRSKGGRKGGRGGRKSKGANLPSFAIANAPNKLGKIKISNSKAPTSSLKIAQVRQAKKANIKIAKQAKTIKKTPSMV